MQESRVGSKGKFFPPKDVRKKLGLNAHAKVIYKIESGRLIVEPFPTLEEVLSEPPCAEITLAEFHIARKELSQMTQT